MNIDNSNLLAMLSMSDGMESLTQKVLDETVLSGEFSEALLDKLKQLQDLSTADLSNNKLSLDAIAKDSSLHEIAALLNRNNLQATYPEFSGKSLPSGKELQGEIDLQQTLEDLTQVLKTLQEGVENTAVEELQTSDQASSPEVLKQKLQQLSSAIEQNIDYHESAETAEQLELSQAALEQLQSTIAELENLQLDKLVVESGVIQSRVEITESVEALTAESIEKVVSALQDLEQNIVDPQLSKEIKQVKQIIEQLKVADYDEAVVEDEATLMTHLAAIMRPEPENQPIEKPVVAQTHAKQATGLKSIAAEQATGLTDNEDLDSLLAEDELQLKAKTEEPSNALLAKKQANPGNQSQTPAESVLDRTLPRFAADIALMNRAVLAENKAELPAMTKHFAHPEWGQEMGERIVWMHKRAIPSAELRLNPEHLGPVRIKIDINQEQATVAFSAQHAAVKEAIDAALPRLRELFSAQQIHLAEVTVSQDESGQKQPRGFAQTQGDGGQGEKQPEDNPEQGETAVVMDIVDEIEAGRAIASNGVLSIFA